MVQVIILVSVSPDLFWAVSTMHVLGGNPKQTLMVQAPTLSVLPWVRTREIWTRWSAWCEKIPLVHTHLDLDCAYSKWVFIGFTPLYTKRLIKQFLMSCFVCTDGHTRTFRSGKFRRHAENCKPINNLQHCIQLVPLETTWTQEISQDSQITWWEIPLSRTRETWKEPKVEQPHAVCTYLTSCYSLFTYQQNNRGACRSSSLLSGNNKGNLVLDMMSSPRPMDCSNSEPFIIKAVKVDPVPAKPLSKYNQLGFWELKAIANLENRHVDAFVEGANRALSNNNPKLSNLGTGGAYFVSNSDKTAAVFKPTDEEPQAPNNPRGTFPIGSVFQEGLKKGTRPGEGEHNETVCELKVLDSFHNRSTKELFLQWCRFVAWWSFGGLCNRHLCVFVLLARCLERVCSLPLGP